MNENKAMSESIIQTCGKFCQALTRDEVETFLRFTTTRDIDPKGIVAEIGDVGDEFYLLIEGGVSLLEQNDSTEIEVGRIEPGGLVGEMSFFDKLPRTLRLRATKNGAKLVVINRSMYRRITIEHPFIAVNMLEFIILSLDKLVRSTSKDISSLHRSLGTAQK